MAASGTTPTGDLACNPGLCPDWESNQEPFYMQAGTQATEPHQPGPCLCSVTVQDHQGNNRSHSSKTLELDVWGEWGAHTSQWPPSSGRAQAGPSPKGLSGKVGGGAMG